MAYDAGEAFIQILPSFAGVLEKITAEARKWAPPAARTFADTFKRDVQASLRGMEIGPSTRESARQGQSSGGAFADAFKARVAAALRDLPNPKVGLDATELDAELADIRRRLAALGDVRVGVDLSTDEALAELDALKARLDALGARSPDIAVQVDVAKASAELAVIQAEVDHLDGQTATVDVKARSDLGSGVSGLFASILGLGPALIPVGAVAGAGVAALAPALASAGAGAGVVALAFHGVATTVKELGQASTATGATLATLKAKLADVNPATLSFAKFVQGTLEPAFHRLQQVAAAGFLPGVEAGLKAMAPLFPPFTRFVGSLATTMGTLATQAGKALTDPFWRQFFTYVASTAGPTIIVMVRIVGNLAKGFAGLLEAFAPVTKEIGAGLLSLSARFADFGANAGKSAGFQRFLAYVHREGPVVVQTLGSIVRAVGHLLVALAPIGDVLLKGIGQLANIISAIPTPLLTGLAVAIGGVVLALKALKIATGIEKTIESVIALYGKLGFAAEGAAAKEELALNAPAAGGGGAGLLGLGGAGAASAFSSTLAAIIGPAIVLAISTKLAESGTANPAGRGIFSNESASFVKQFPNAALLVSKLFPTIANANQTQFETGRNASGLDQNKIVARIATTGSAKELDALVRLGRIYPVIGAAIAAFNKRVGESNSQLTGLAAASRHVAAAESNMSAVVAKVGSGSLSKSTAAGQANRDALTGAAKSVKQYRDSLVAAGTPLAVVQLKTRAYASSLLSQAVATYGSKKQVDRLLTSLHAMPKQVATRLAVLGIASATRGLQGLKHWLDLIHNKTVDVTVRRLAIQEGPGHQLVNLPAGSATGGMIRGPGTSTSDSVLRRLSTGEFVVNAAATSRNLPLLDYINSHGFAAGGPVAAPRAFSQALSGASGGADLGGVTVFAQFGAETIEATAVRVVKQRAARVATTTRKAT
jgi:hypothetical protein